MNRDPALFDRMAALVREMALIPTSLRGHLADEAAAIAALLPEPVDPDLLEARKIVVGNHSELGFSDFKEGVLKGRFDDLRDVLEVLAGIKRGRELALQERGE